jgi:toxin ParE1/3/4
MAFQIIWSDTAREDFKEIIQYIAMDNLRAAASLADRIIHRIEIASDLPFSSRKVPEKDDELVREAILKPYRIIYLVDNKKSTIHVLRIWHASRGIPVLESSTETI